MVVAGVQLVYLAVLLSMVAGVQLEYLAVLLSKVDTKLENFIFYKCCPRNRYEENTFPTSI